MDETQFNKYREYDWWCADGRVIKIRNLEDTHLANIISHVQQPSHPNLPVYPAWLLPVLRKEADLRKLTEVFLTRAPIPWKDVDGKWKRLNLELGEYEVIGR